MGIPINRQQHAPGPLFGLMRIRYVIDRRDIVSAQMRELFESWIFAVFLLLLVTFAGWIAFSGGRFEGTSLSTRFAVATFIIALSAGGGILSALGALAMQAAILKDGEGALGDHVLVLLDNGFLKQKDRAVSGARLSALFKVKETKHYAQIYVGDDLLLIIPLRRPALLGSPREFVDEFRRRSKGSSVN